MGTRIPDPQEIRINQHDLWKYSNAYLKAGENGGAFARIHYHEDGSINEEWTYSKTYRDELHGKDNIDNTEKESDSSETTEKEGCLMKMIKAPFKWLLQALWWLTKKILGILTLGLLSSWLNDDK